MHKFFKYTQVSSLQNGTKIRIKKISLKDVQNESTSLDKKAKKDELAKKQMLNCVSGNTSPIKIEYSSSLNKKIMDKKNISNCFSKINEDKLKDQPPLQNGKKN